jgi:hypothetical protein
MVDTLSAITLKLARTDKHLATLDQIEKRALDGHTDIAVGQFEPDGMAYVYRLRPLPPVPDKFFIPMGETIYHLRTVLDYLALAMNAKGHGSITTKMLNRSQFPICENRTQLCERVGWIEWVDYLAARAIEDLQPYVGGERYHDLAILNHLANVDKHRYSPVTVTALLWYGVPSNPGDPRFIRADTPPLEPGAEIGRYVFDSPQTEVPMDPHFQPGIAFSEVGPVCGHPVIWTLTAALRFIREKVLVTLTPFI